jgi:hypothetical protein
VVFDLLVPNRVRRLLEIQGKAQVEKRFGIKSLQELYSEQIQRI